MDIIIDLTKISYMYIYIGMADESKYDIIKMVYYSDEIGFGSVASTWREANKQHPFLDIL